MVAPTIDSSTKKEKTTFSPDEEFEKGMYILEIIYADGDASQLKMVRDFSQQGYSMSEFVEAIDRNRLPGIDLDDVGYDFAVYRRITDFIESNAPSYLSRLDNNLKSLPNDFDPENQKYTAIANELIDEVRQRLIASEREAEERQKLFRQTAEIPKSGTIAQIFSDASRFDSIRTISNPRIDDDTATITITWLGGSVSELKFQESRSGTANTTDPGTELSSQIADFYLSAAYGQHYDDQEMREQYTGINDALKNRTVNLFFNSIVNLVSYGATGGMLYVIIKDAPISAIVF